MQQLEKIEKSALILSVTEQLNAKGKGCGGTHLQKAVFFLQNLLEAPIGFKYILYKHSPFSFDLQDELTTLRANEFLELQIQPYLSEPSFVPTKIGNKVKQRCGETTLKNYAKGIEFIAKLFGNKRMDELERLTTALYVIKQDGSTVKNIHERAKRIHELQPHVSIKDAREAVETVTTMLEDISTLLPTTKSSLLQDVQLTKAVG